MDGGIIFLEAENKRFYFLYLGLLKKTASRTKPTQQQCGRKLLCRWWKEKKDRGQQRVAQKEPDKEKILKASAYRYYTS